MQPICQQLAANLAAILVLISTQLATVAAEELTQADLFPADRVIDVRIDLAEDDWDLIRRQTRNVFEVLHERRKDAPIAGPYEYVEAAVTIDGRRFENVGVRKKGFIGSQSSSRPSLKIKLNHQNTQSEIDGLTNLTLNNNKQDPTLICQFMGYALFNSAGSPAPRCSFASVTVNGKHLGVYSHVESMRRPLFDREFGSDCGVLYEGTVVDFLPDWAGSLEKKFGNDKFGREKIEQLIGALEDVSDNHGESDDEKVERTIGELVDLDAFYTFWAAEGLLGSWDGYSGNRNNYFVYLHPESDRFHFLPWGGDAMFQKYSKIAPDPSAPLSVKTTGLVAHRLYQTEAGRLRYAQNLQRLLDTVWDEEALLAETDRIEEMLKPHLASAQSEHREKLDEVRDFIRTRRSDLLAEISKGMPRWDRPPEPPPVIPAAIAQQQKSNTIWKIAKTGDLDAIRAWLAKGGDVNTRNFDGATPLSTAALGDQPEVIELLIEAGADVNNRNNDGHAALHGATFFGRLSAATALVEGGADVNIRNNNGETPLNVATAEWTDDTTKFAEFIAQFLQLDFDAATAAEPRSKIAALLRQHGAKLGADLPPIESNSIWQAAKRGDVDRLKQFMAEEGVDLDARDEKGVTALCWAALAGQVAAMDLLIDAGANVDARNLDGGAPLHSAAFFGHRQAVELLIEHQAEINATNQRRETPLAAVDGEWNPQTKAITEFVARLLNLNVDVAKVKAARPEIAALLRKHGGKTGTE